MALTPSRSEPGRTAGHVSHDAQMRIDKRIERILARHERALRAAQTTVARPKAPDEARTRR
jgi:hypothetical protein